MKIAILIAALLIVNQTYSQFYRPSSFEDIIHGLTTIVTVKKYDSDGKLREGYGSGFFYHQYKRTLPAFPDLNTNAVDTTIKNIWLVTNKHVLFTDYERKQPNFPVAVEFYLRRIVKGKEVPVWDTIRIRRTDLSGMVKMHTDSLVDVVAINVTKLILPLLLKGDSLYYYSAVSRENFPNPDIAVDYAHGTTTGREVLAIGYPRRFFDTFNLYPTVKSGIIASKWKAKYDGQPFFLIDCKLFPGSSGSIIISHYTTFGAQNDKWFNWFEFLGVYSGEFIRKMETIQFEEMTITKKENYNTGNVWYYYLIEEIIN